jgi:hypothetical protein
MNHELEVILPYHSRGILYLIRVNIKMSYKPYTTGAGGVAFDAVGQ